MANVVQAGVYLLIADFGTNIGPRPGSNVYVGSTGRTFTARFYEQGLTRRGIAYLETKIELPARIVNDPAMLRRFEQLLILEKAVDLPRFG